MTISIRIHTSKASQKNTYRPVQPNVRAQEPLQALGAVHELQRVPIEALRPELVHRQRRRLELALVSCLEPRVDARLLAERLGRVDAEPVEQLVVVLALRDERPQLRAAEARLDRVDELPVRHGDAEHRGLEDLHPEARAVLPEPVDDVRCVRVEPAQVLELLVCVVVEALQAGIMRESCQRSLGAAN